MGLLEALAIALGPAIAKHLLKAWLGEGLPGEILASLIDLLRDKAKGAAEQRENARLIDRIGETIARQMQPIFDLEYRHLSLDERAVAARTAAETIGRIAFSTALLVDLRLDRTRLNKAILESKPDADRLLSGDQASMYKRIIGETSRLIVEQVTQLPNFDSPAWRRNYADHEEIAEQLDELILLIRVQQREEVRRGAITDMAEPLPEYYGAQHFAANRVANLESALSNAFPYYQFATALVDQKIIDELDTLRKSRFFTEFDRVGTSLAFARRLVGGEFSGGSNSVRSLALAWCARVLSRSEELDKAERYLELTKELGTCPEIVIAEAFIFSQKGDRSTSLILLASIDKPSSRSAALMVVAHHDGLQGAVDWLMAAEINMGDLDPDGKNSLLTYLLQLGHWEAARNCIDALIDEDFVETPILNHMVAVTHLISTVPEELRHVVLSQIPFESKYFPLASDANAVEARRVAHRYFISAAQIEKQLNLPIAATIDDDYALWLELKDPEEAIKGRLRLQANLREPETALRFVHLALQFGVPLDIATVEREIQRQIALHGGITQNAAIARFALAFTQKTPEDVANYVNRYRDELAKYFDKKMLQSLEIEMLSKAGLLERANDFLKVLKKEGLSGEEESRLRIIIAEAEGGNPVESRKEQFKITDSLSDLVSLVVELENRGEWDALCEYSQILFERTHTLDDAVRLAVALYNSQKTDRLVAFVKTNSDLLAHSRHMHMLYCWALYKEGSLVEARSEITKLSDLRDNPDYRALQINLGIAMGDWNSLLVFVANERLERDKRSAQELIKTAQLALHIGSPFAKELTFAAADKGKDDAIVLTTAYMLATNAGWEDDDKVTKWLERASRLSGDNGPIHMKTIKDILDMQPEWDQRVSEVWRSFNLGEIPMFLAAHSLNKSLIEMMLFPAYGNLLENDPRRRGVIPAYSGKRQPLPLNVKGKVGIEATALLTLSYLNLLDKVLDYFDTVYVPHATLTWLFEEKRKAAFHQPSRIREAHRIRDLLATDGLAKLQPSTVPDSELSYQVGDELAVLIAEAENARGNDDTQRIVVRPSPVHRLSSLMMEDADLTNHAAVLSSCQAVVNKLRSKGQITAKEEMKALAYLQFQERPWPSQPDILDGAILYMDGLAITYFLRIGILDKLRAAGFRPIASPWKISETNDLITYERISGNVNEAIEHIRSALNTRIETGKIKVGRQRVIDDPDKQSLYENPTTGVFTLTRDCNVVVADDRFLNQHAVIEDNGEQVPISSTLDLIDALLSSGSISIEEHWEYKTSLRRAGYFFVPISGEELSTHLRASSVKDNRVLETIELKAIRENFLHVRMSNWLQIPNELLWLDMSRKAYIQALKSFWAVDQDLSSIRVRSDWILSQIDVRGWAHRFNTENRDNIVNIGRGSDILMLLTPPLDASREINEEYWNWVEGRVLVPIKEQYPELYSWIVEWHRKEIDNIINRYLKE